MQQESSEVVRVRRRQRRPSRRSKNQKLCLIPSSLFDDWPTGLSSLHADYPQGHKRLSPIDLLASNRFTFSPIDFKSQVEYQLNYIPYFHSFNKCTFRIDTLITIMQHWYQFDITVISQLCLKVNMVLISFVVISYLQRIYISFQVALFYIDHYSC